MLLYPLSEAILLLADRLRGAKRSLRHTVKDLEFLREQVTVMEVNFARVHNVSLLAFRPLAAHADASRRPVAKVGCEAPERLEAKGAKRHWTGQVLEGRRVALPWLVWHEPFSLS